MGTSMGVCCNGTVMMDSTISTKLEPGIGAFRQHAKLLFQFQTLEEFQRNWSADVRQYYFIYSWFPFVSELSWFPSVDWHLILIT